MMMIELSRVWRQKDAELVATLNRIRCGDARPEDVEWLNAQCGAAAAAAAAPPAGGGLAAEAAPPRPMLLAPTNAVVSERNVRELAAMVSRAAACQWIAEDWVDVDESCPGGSAAPSRHSPSATLRVRRACLARRRAAGDARVAAAAGARPLLLISYQLLANQ